MIIISYGYAWWIQKKIKNHLSKYALVLESFKRIYRGCWGKIVNE